MSVADDMFVVMPDGSYYLSAKEQKRRSAALRKILKECSDAAADIAAAMPWPKPGDPDYVDWAAIFNTPICPACNGTGRLDGARLMSQMVERVAKELFEANPYEMGRLGYADRQHLARAAIAAMREPTREMIVAGLRVMERTDAHASSSAIWQSMIDAALKEPPTER